MRKNNIIRVVVLAMLISTITGCSKPIENKKSTEEPEITQIRSICELATLECYYHNVAKSVKTAGKGITHIGEKDRKFWIEYEGTVKLGIEMSKVKMAIEGDSITISIPEAKVLDVKVNEDSYNPDSYIESKDSFNSNKITADDTTKAVNDAKKEMEKSAQQNSALLMNAQDRAKELIENYINQLGEATGNKYTINWEYLDNSIASNEEPSEGATSEGE